jgi:heparosan-N-sulfate-glucuronate 5-epimerase
MKIKKIGFMINKLRVDLFGKKIPYDISAFTNGPELTYYYFNFKDNPKKLNRLIAGFDKEGIPLNRAYIDVERPSLHYYPITIGQYALAVFHSFLADGDEQRKQHFLRIADWFVHNCNASEEQGNYWLTDVPKPEYKVAEPWKSAFVQSRALSVLLRAWQITSNSQYLEIAKRALIPFTRDIREGGVTANLKEGHPFYEEYVAAEPTMVLDGHIFSLFGLHEFTRAVAPRIDLQHHNLARELFINGIESLLYFLPAYDMGYGLRFNLCRMAHYPQVDPCTVGYLRLVTAQLNVLAQITDNTHINKWYQKIKQYDRPAHVLRIYKLKYHALKQLNRL